MAIVMLAALMALAGLESAAPLNSISLAQGGTRERLSTATDPLGRITLMTRVNGKGPFPFTIDTGANRSVVSDRLAAELDLPVQGVVTVEGVSGTDIVGAVDIDHIKAGFVEQRRLHTAVLPAEALGATGFLGTDMLQGRNVILDFRRHIITLTRARGDAEGETITVDASRNNGQLVMTDASVGAIRVVAIIDTGAENSIANPALRRRLLGSKPSGPVNAILGVTGKSIAGETGKLPKVRVGAMELGNIPVVYANSHTFHILKLDDVPAVLVGMDVLRLFNRVVIDFRRSEVRFNIGANGNPATLQALNRPRNEKPFKEGYGDGGACLLARADQAGVGIDSGRDLFRD